ncbi:MAG: metallophosphoesterase family protein [Janthinobacterium lividum]
MRILHTGDWHIGQTLRGYARDREHQAVLDDVVRVAAEREVDLLIVAGDVYDTQNPSGASQRLFYETLVALNRARPAMTTVIVAGNHDAPARLEAPHPLLQAFDVHVLGSVRRRDGVIDAGRHLVPVRVAGEVAAHVLAVSYPTAACLPTLEDEGEGSPVARAVRSLYDELWTGTRHQHGGVPVIATGHLHVAGGLESEGAERRILVGGAHAVEHDVFPSEAAYVALGHLHRAQKVGRDTVRYCGSLIPLSATEMGYRHTVTLVTLGGAGPAVEQVPVGRPVPFLRMPERGETTVAELGDRLAALGLPRYLPLDQRPFIQVHVSREGLAPGFREEVDRIAEVFPVRVVDVRVPPLPDVVTDVARAIVTTRLADIDPVKVFEAAFERKLGHAPEPRHRHVFDLLRSEG